MYKCNILKNDHLVSVLIPVFNGERYITDAIRSVSTQSYKNLEIIVVADGCTDDTVSRINELAEKDSRIYLIVQEENIGVHLSRANGMVVARGAYISFIDADDWIHPEFVRKMLSILVQKNADIAVCGICFSDNSGYSRGYKVRFSKNEIVGNEILSRFCQLDFGTGSLCNKIYRREVIERFVAYDFGERVSINEDYLVNFGAFYTANRVCLLQDVLYYYRQHSSNTTRLKNKGNYFAHMLRAYVVCLETYVHEDSALRSYVDRLYANQLRFDAYRVMHRQELEEFSEYIAESLRRLADIHPTAIYDLCHLFENHRQGLLYSLSNFYKNIWLLKI